MIKMNEYRCYNCNNTLCKATEDLDIEVICSKCRRINYPARNKDISGLRGQNFNSKCINHQCPQCKRLLLKTIGYGYIELKCCAKHCNWTGTQNTLEIRRKISNLTKVAMDKIRLKMETYIIEKPITKKPKVKEDPKITKEFKAEINLDEPEGKVFSEEKEEYVQKDIIEDVVIERPEIMLKETEAIEETTESVENKEKKDNNKPVDKKDKNKK